MLQTPCCLVLKSTSLLLCSGIPPFCDPSVFTHACCSYHVELFLESTCCCIPILWAHTVVHCFSFSSMSVDLVSHLFSVKISRIQRRRRGHELVAWSGLWLGWITILSPKLFWFFGSLHSWRFPVVGMCTFWFCSWIVRTVSAAESFHVAWVFLSETFVLFFSLCCLFRCLCCWWSCALWFRTENGCSSFVSYLASFRTNQTNLKWKALCFSVSFFIRWGVSSKTKKYSATIGNSILTGGCQLVDLTNVSWCTWSKKKRKKE